MLGPISTRGTYCIRDAAAEVDSIIEAIRLHVLARAAAKLRALVLVDRQNREDGV